MTALATGGQPGLVPATGGQPFLDGLRVLDLTTALSGPYCTSILADLGAEVISVEPVNGDAMRARRSARNAISYPFEMVHHDKRSIAVNLRDPRGARVLADLAGTVDVVVENFRPGVLARHGLDASTLRQRDPRLVYCSISGYGQTGPLHDLGGVDLVAQAHAGLMSVTGEPDGLPCKAGFPVSDVGAGMWAAIAIVAALHRRSATGEGSTIDIALTDALLAWAVWEVADYQMTGVVPGGLGTAHRLAAPYQAFRCEDGRWLAFAGLATRWPEFCRTIGADDLLRDPRFASEAGRYAEREPLAQIIGERLATAPRSSWLARLRGIGIPAGPVNTIADAMDDDQFRARDMWRPVNVGDTAVSVINTPIKSDGSPGVRAPAPAVGEHSAELLAGLGYDAETIAAYITAAVISAADCEPSRQDENGSQ
jgi:crotonobetainyl-CoA:carnitine CoA-transferase CaiB-like acyl-CoA transferase